MPSKVVCVKIKPASGLAGGWIEKYSASTFIIQENVIRRRPTLVVLALQKAFLFTWVFDMVTEMAQPSCDGSDIDIRFDKKLSNWEYMDYSVGIQVSSKHFWTIRMIV